MSRQRRKSRNQNQSEPEMAVAARLRARSSVNPKLPTTKRDVPPAHRGRIRDHFEEQGQDQEQDQDQVQDRIAGQSQGVGSKHTTLKLEDPFEVDATLQDPEPKPEPNADLEYRAGPYFTGDDPEMGRVFPDQVFIEAWLERVKEAYPGQMKLHREAAVILALMRYTG